MITPIWHLISDKARKDLAGRYKDMCGCDIKPPVWRFQKLIIDPKLTSVKIERLVRQKK